MKTKKTRHTSLTESAAKVHKALILAGYRPHPGIITPRSGRGGILRIKITAEPGRTRITVSGGGVQELYLYGAVEQEAVAEVIRARLGGAVKITLAQLSDPS